MPIFTVPANASINIDLPARYLLIDSITLGKSLILKGRSKNFDIEFTVRGGGKISQLPEVVSDWVFKNNNAIDVDVVIQGGEVYYDENRLDGDVNAITTVDNKTLNGNEFFCGHNIAAVVGRSSYAGLYNPVGSGIKTIVNAVEVQTTFFSNYHFFNASDYAAANFPIDETCYNKEVGSGNSATKKVGGALIGWPGLIIDLSIPANNFAITKLEMKKSPIVLPEGRGFIIKTAAANSQLTFYSEFYEE